mmetsp:Transcript_49000/g.78955  ORF Transcript_49000/g.78955 Transcript_49000/m.78955 type:complete len:565 (+) Transcript_49000:121-1815(+)
MLITSTTTCAAFLCSLTTPIPGSQGFGIFAALVIAADYVLVMTLFCTAVMVYHNRFEKPPLCGFQIPTPIGPCQCGCCCENCSCAINNPTPTEKALAASHGNIEVPADGVELFFRTKFAPMILKPRNRVIIAVVVFVWMIPCIYFVFQLVPTEKQEQFLKDDHPIQKAISALNDKFPVSSTDRGIDVFYTWGLQDVDRNGANVLLNITYVGEPRYDPAFKFTPQCMAKLKEVCDGFQNNVTDEYLGLVQRNSKGGGSVKCVVYDLETRGTERNWDLTTEDKMKSHMDEFMKLRAVPESDDADSRDTVAKKYKEMMGWDGEQIKFVGIAIESKNLTLYNRPPEEITRANWKAYEELRNNVDFIAAEACGGNVQMTDLIGKFVFMNNQMIYRTSAIRGALIGIGIAFLVLLACTWSLLISVLSTISILCTMLSVIGLVTMIGWNLGTVQAILISILAGFSVDYVVHLAHAYAHSPLPTREERVVSAFSEMGAPVLSGMITSVLASLPLFACNLVFFSQFGTFLCFTILFSWLFANFAFMSALATIGPQGPPSAASNKVDDDSKMPA